MPRSNAVNEAITNPVSKPGSTAPGAIRITRICSQIRSPPKRVNAATSPVHFTVLTGQRPVSLSPATIVVREPQFGHDFKSLGSHGQPG